MITRIRFALTFAAPFFGAFAGVLVGGLLTLVAEECFAQSQDVGQRGIRRVEYHDARGRRIGAYERSYALLIGVSSYDSPEWTALPSIPEEINRVEAALRKHGFQVKQVLNPGEDDLKRAFENFIDSYGYDEKNRLLFFFAGHGYTRMNSTDNSTPKNSMKGYLVPADAPEPWRDERAFLSKALAIDQIITWARNLEANHALFLFDSCFSGTIFQTRQPPKEPPHITDLTSRPVRQFITAGSAQQRVPARSIFVPALIRALEGEADLNDDGYVTGTELGMYIHEMVLKSATGLTPQCDKLYPHLDQGDFIFRLPTPPVPQGPDDVIFPIEDYRAEEEAYQQVQAKWERYLQDMGENLDQVEELVLPPARMVAVWSGFLEAFSQDDPFSEDDEELRKMAEGRLAYWREKAGIADAGTIHAERPAASSKVCLDLLESTKQPRVSGDLRLGRIHWKGKIMEPVLIRKNTGDRGTGYSFRKCSGGQPIDSSVSEVEIFNSALVAHFDHEKTGVLTTYREVQNLGYKPIGAAKLTFRGAGTMLEARRLDDGHVEITGTDLVQISHLKRITILLITTRDTMKSMEPKIWDLSWGEGPEDSKILREILWWELTRPGYLRIHPAVNSFEDLASLAAGSAGGTNTDWDRVLDKNLKSLLDRNVLSLLVAEQSDHIDLAKRMLDLANETNNDAELDVGSLGEDWKGSTRLRLEEAASRGRYWPFTHPFDLAAIMPDRIAGKIRRNYYDRPSYAETMGVDTDFAKDYVMLATDSPAFQVANAVFQDQAAWLARTMDFLECLLENDAALKRFGILEEALERLNISTERLEEMDVDKAFRDLLQGFSLPVDLPAGERSFLRSLNSGDPEVLRLVRSLQGYFNTAALESDEACKIVLIPDAVLDGEPIEPLVVASIPEISLSTPADSEASESGSSTDNYDDAMQARAEARIALKRAIYANALKHRLTRGKIRRGHELLKRGNIIVLETNGEGPAAKEFREARDLFLKAEEKAFRIEHRKPKLRVH